jgi:lysophospholipase L1-like esterase
VIAEKFTTDGLHPNDAGYQRLFRIIDRYIENLE